MCNFVLFLTIPLHLSILFYNDGCIPTWKYFIFSAQDGDNKVEAADDAAQASNKTSA